MEFSNFLFLMLTEIQLARPCSLRVKNTVHVRAADGTVPESRPRGLLGWQDCTGPAVGQGGSWPCHAPSAV